MATYDLRVNGFARSAEADDPDKPLLYVLRGLGLTAAKFGCGLGQCGACTVLIDGNPVALLPDADRRRQGQDGHHAGGSRLTGAPHPVQAAFIKEQVPQCGYCTSGMIMSAAALLARNTEADRAAGPLRARRQSLPLRLACARRARGDGARQARAGRLT